VGYEYEAPLKPNVIYLAVEDTTGDIDYTYIGYCLHEKPFLDKLIEGYSWKAFKIIPEAQEGGDR